MGKVCSPKYLRFYSGLVEIRNRSAQGCGFQIKNLSSRHPQHKQEKVDVVQVQLEGADDDQAPTSWVISILLADLFQLLDMSFWMSRPVGLFTRKVADVMKYTEQICCQENQAREYNRSYI